MEKKKKVAIVVAAGQGRRMGPGRPKQFAELCGHEVIYYSLRAFEESSADEIILVVGADDVARCREDIVRRYGFSKVSAVIAGGRERYDSVYAGLNAAGDCDYVLIHDGARPLVTPEMIDEIAEGAERYGCCTSAVPVKDTIKTSDAEGMAEDTPERERLWAIHTPQGFEYGLIMRAHELFREKGCIVPVTDDTMLTEIFMNKKTKLIEGSYRNIKITTPEDLKLAEALLQ